MKNLKLYAKVICMINSCIDTNQLENTRKYIDLIEKTDSELSSALKYPLELKREVLVCVNDIEVEYEALN